MSILPGLNLSAPPTLLPQAQTARTQDLPAGSEYRFEVSFRSSLRIKLLTGTAELFGTELAASSHQAYTFSGTKAAIYTWDGCTLELTGETESEYVAEETTMSSYANVHFALERLRDGALAAGGLGPRVLIVGPENAGKTSLAKMLTAYANKAERLPVVVNLDPRQGMLAPPGAFSAATFAGILDVEEGWGSSSISGPTAIPAKVPLVYHYGLPSPEDNGGIFKPLVTRMALAVTSRLEEDPDARVSGCIIDTAGAISQGKGGQYENIQHIVSEFSVNVLLVLGSERLYSDLSRRFSAKNGEDAVAVVKLDKSGGCVDRDESYMRQLRQSQVRSYFFGRPGSTLSPHTHMLDHNQLNIFRIDQASGHPTLSFLPGDDEDSAHASTSLYEQVQPSMMMQNCLLAVTSADPYESEENIRDASIMGYVYVADVDEAKKKVRILAPVSGRVPPKALVWGSWPEDVADLVG
ncbi:Cleavage polyadenylation factor subunit clp1 [Coniosporium apollinis]|uniref:Polynucleotide 5'-hydroxyl-kinase GRC3 n=2 Tax=Coniosporium TaxID=2810619 RepID=A0ABQ9P5Q8_9PEZI|nr:Cleavage polyadenylation factor subunit clp1 [Cladosporium sp. JES 115]KAJ9669423.1 Cleavage polyadenylation factor subunit clp1 [Coniosporium apollinis]